MERMLRVKDIVKECGVSAYQARRIMAKAGQVNIGNSEDFPRYALPASRLEAYFQRNTDREHFSGLDEYGRLLRR